eukprot:CAMPEP_0168768650 /NCGR_PEP_ID=MMETSP0725-20121227/1992_1 /TAXON_ID=265536 /ORGANISM="Amphiprora sp., Strain CCMP467" /LENGTH=220 /DNA_ID=CAMNT_0008818027 /DNA_START=21 /DNA_END=683 /DNA_ORIENTATION=+
MARNRILRSLWVLLIGGIAPKTSFAQTCVCICPSPEVGDVPFRQIFTDVEYAVVSDNEVTSSSMETCTCACPTESADIKLMNDVLSNVDAGTPPPTSAPTQCIPLQDTCLTDDTLPEYVPCCVGMTCRNIGPYEPEFVCLVTVPSDAEREDDPREYHPGTDPARCPPGRARNENCRRLADASSSNSTVATSSSNSTINSTVGSNHVDGQPDQARQTEEDK